MIFRAVAAALGREDFSLRGGTHVVFDGTDTPVDPTTLPGWDAEAYEAFSPVPDLTFRQLLIGLTTEGWITIEEGQAWRARNALPGVVTAAINAAFATPQDRFTAETNALAATDIQRGHALVAIIAATADKSEPMVDEFFRTYAGT